MPVKDSPETTERAVRAITGNGDTLTIYNDFSTPDNTARLEALAQETGSRLIHLSDLTDHASPNYRLVLQHAQKQALDSGQDLIIVESDVIIRPDTIKRLLRAAYDNPRAGLVAAVTTDENGQVNFPYLYAKKWDKGCIDTGKRLSFCCTLLTNGFLNAFDFDSLDPRKDWYDVFLSHKSRELGFRNLLLTDTPVLHLPHSSRPWKRLKYTNPLLYYWRKLIHRKDRI